MPLGSLVAGLTLSAVGARDALVLLAVATVVVAAGATAVRTLRSAPEPEEL
jgi:hypothetical protein